MTRRYDDVYARFRNLNRLLAPATVRATKEGMTMDRQIIGMCGAY